MKKRNYCLPIGFALSFALLLPIFFPEFMNESGFAYPETMIDLDAIEYAAIMLGGIRTAMLVSVLSAAIRLAAAVAIGVLAGFGSWSFGKLIGLFEASFGILPAAAVGLAISFGIFSNGAFQGHYLWSFVVLLSLIGWSGPAKKISSGIKELQENSISKGRKAAGEGQFSIARGNAWRFLKKNMVIVFFDQVAKVLTFIAQLCVFYAILGGAGIEFDSVAKFFPSWLDRPLPAIIFAGAFFMGSFGFGLMAEGLRRRRGNALENRQADAPFSATAAALCATCLLAVMFAYLNVPVSDFSMAEMHRTLDFERTGELIPGSSMSRERASLIASELEKMGYAPHSVSFERNYERSETYVPVYDELVLDAANERFSYVAGEDYIADTFGMFDLSGKVFDGRKIDYYSLDERRGDFLGKWILLERRSYSEEDTIKFAEKFMLDYHAKGILFVDDKLGRRYSAQGKELSRKPVLSVNREMADDLAEAGASLSYRQVPKSIDGRGVYVLAEIDGERAEKGETIVVGLSYGWQYEPIKSGKIEFGLELASRFASMREGMNKTIVLAFFDTAGGADRDELCSLAENMPFDKEDVGLFVDLTGIYEGSSGRVFYSRQKGGEGQGFAEDFERTMRSAIEKKGYPFECGQMKRVCKEPFAIADGADAVYIAFEPCRGSQMDIEDLGEIIVESIARLGR